VGSKLAAPPRILAPTRHGNLGTNLNRWNFVRERDKPAVIIPCALFLALFGTIDELPPYPTLSSRVVGISYLGLQLLTLTTFYRVVTKLVLGTLSLLRWSPPLGSHSMSCLVVFPSRNSLSRSTPIFRRSLSFVFGFPIRTTE
jgi:hypothetical protein